MSLSLRPPCQTDRSPVTSTPTLSGLGVAILLLGAVLPFLDMFIVNVALPSIASTLSASAPMLELTIAGYGTAYALLLIVGGRLGDAYGRRTVFLVGLTGFSIASLACGIASSVAVLVGARVAQGATAALIMPQVLGTFHAALPDHRRGQAIGLYGATAGVAAVAGQLVGGLLIAAHLTAAAWRPIFLVNVPIGIVTLAAAWRLVPDTRSPHPASVDLPGTALLATTMLALLVPLTEGRSLGWPLWTWIALAGSVPAAVATCLVERRAERRGQTPLLPPSMIAMRSMRRGGMLAMPFFMAFGAFMFVFSLTVQQDLHHSALTSGLAITPLAVAFFAGSMITPWLLARYGRSVITAGGLLQFPALASMVIVALTSWPHVHLLALVPGLAVAGFAASLIFVSIFRLLLADVPPRLAGIGGGLVVTLQQSSYALGVATLGTLFLSLQPRHPAAGFGWVVGVQAAVSLGVAGGSIGLARHTVPRGNPTVDDAVPGV